MTENEKAGAEVEALEAFLESQPEEVRDLLQYALAKLMVEEGKGTFGEEFKDAQGRGHMQVVTRSGQTFMVTKPAVDDKMLEQMMAIVRQAQGQAGTDTPSGGAAGTQAGVDPASGTAEK